MKMKYVLMEYMGVEMPFVFPCLVTHSDFVTGFRGGYPGSTVISAGFCVLRDTVWTCYGDSVSLKTKSRDKDSDVLTRTFGISC